MFKHTLKDTLNNIYSGVIKYYNHLFLASTASSKERNINAIILPKINYSDLSLLGFYSNNLEPQSLKDIQKIIGKEETYRYIVKNSLGYFLQEGINYLQRFLEVKASIFITNMIQNPNNDQFRLFFLHMWFYKYLQPKMTEPGKYLIEQIIYGPKDNIKLQHIIQRQILAQEFLPLYLKDNTENEYYALENNIVSILQYYSQNLATCLTAVMISVPAIYRLSYPLFRQTPYIKLSLITSFGIVAASIAGRFFTKEALIVVMKEDSYKNAASFSNVIRDHYNIKEVLFIMGPQHLSDRKILHDKLSLKIKEENIPLDIFNLLLDFNVFQEISSFYYATKHSIASQVIEPKVLLENSGNFVLANDLLSAVMQKLFSLFVSANSVDFQMNQVSKIIQAIDNYTENHLKKLTIYQKNNSTKLIISNLKVDIHNKNKTIVDFSGHDLVINIIPGKHYLMEGQNSVGKSLLLKLIIGYSAGLNIEGVISYPQGLEKADIAYIMQDDYMPYLKPLLHRLAVPKLLLADLTANSLLNITQVMDIKEFDHFVDFMSELLFRMKYEPTWQNVLEAKESLLANYQSYIKLMNIGDSVSFDQVAKVCQNLSGGQKKKLAIANVIYNKAKLIILDESFNAIDQETKLIIYKIIEEYLPESTCIVLQHQVANHLVEEKIKAEKIEHVLSSLSKLGELYDNQEVNNIINEIIKVKNETLTNHSEEKQFYHTLVTMSRSQVEENRLETSFKIINLQEDSKNLVEFYPNKIIDANSIFMEVDILGDSHQ